MEYHFYSKELTQKTILELKQMLEDGSISSEELVWAYIEHTAAHNEAGLRLRAVREANPDALAAARERDWERNKGETRGPLHGIPILLQDSISTADRMHTAGGCAALKNHYAEEDAFIVKKLREAGAILLGKANMEELYGMVSSTAEKGYTSVLNGTAANPFGPGWITAGSACGGSAAAVAADFCAASIAADHEGSILESAYRTGTVGYKPTVGLVSRTGILPCLACQDAAGPLTRGVRDAALLANVLIGRDETDPDTVRAEAFAESDLAANMDFALLKERRLGIVKQGFYDTLSEKEKELYDAALKCLTDAGAELVEIEGFAPAEKASEAQEGSLLDDTVKCHGFKARMDYCLSRMKDVPFHSVKELTEWNEAHPELIPMGQDRLKRIAAIETPGIMPEFVESRMNALTDCGEMGIWKVMDEKELDALILPGTAGRQIASAAGNPAITLPCAYSKETGPIGLNLIGHLMGDMDLLYLARACEIALPKKTALRL